MSSLREVAEAVQAKEAEAAKASSYARMQTIAHARALAARNDDTAAVCSRDQQSLATFFRENAQALRNLINLAEGKKP